MKTCWKLLLLLCCLSLIAAAKPTQYVITGVSGKVLENLRYRFDELYQNRSILNEPEETLRLQISKALQPFGYFQPTIQIISNPGSKQTHIQIQPGVQIHIANIQITLRGDGAHNQEIKQALHQLPIRVGQPFNNILYEDAKERLLSAAEHQGYLHAVFEKSEALFDLAQHTVNITFIFNTGVQYYFGQVRFDPTYISPELLARYVRFHPGCPYATEPLLNLNTSLETSGYFNAVVIKPEINDKPYVPITVHLQPKNRMNYSLGVGYGTDTGPRGSAGISIVPVNRLGHKFHAVAQGSMNENALLAQYIIPGNNPTVDNFSMNGSLSNLNYNSGYGNAILLSLAQQHAVSRFQRILSLNALDERYHYTYEPNKAKNLIYPKASFTWRSVSEQLFSPSGFNITLTGLASPKIMASGVSLAQTTADAKIALTIEPIRSRLYLHGIQGVTAINHINNLPLSLAMLLGGMENLKAYSFNAIGPGRILSYAGLELQKETIKKWYLLGFVDAGDVYNPSKLQIKYDAGIGLMWVSPVGPIKIGIAQAIDARFNRVSSRSPKFVVNMGPDL